MVNRNKDGQRIKKAKEVFGRVPQGLSKLKKEERPDRRRRRTVGYSRGDIRAHGLEICESGRFINF